MEFVLGMVAGSLISFVVLVAFMAPKHWDTYQENVDLRSQLRVAVERAAHYQNLISPMQWGPQEEHETRTVKTRIVHPDAETGDVRFKFDDIRETP